MPFDNFGTWWPTADDPAFNTGVAGPALTTPEYRAQYEADLAVWQADRLGGLRRVRAAAPPQAEVRAHNRGWMEKYGHLDINKLKDADTYNRGVALQPFKAEYDSHEQIQQKLYQSVILIKGWPFLVQGTIALEKGGFGLLLSDRDGTYKWVNYEEITDCRSLAPGYVNYSSAAYWVYRIPERQNHQGMTARNTLMKAAGTEHRSQGMNSNVLMQSVTGRKNIPFQTNLMDMIESDVFSSVRLSNNLALHKVKNKGAIAGVEYIGRPLGLIVDGRVKVLDDADLGPTWISKDCLDVNLELF